mgnify:CR=1 FL=1
MTSLSARRAWIEISTLHNIFELFSESLSARRAWIEIFYYADKDCDWVVALRKESVDRNSTYVIRLPRCQVSLSARRAWIEILRLITLLKVFLSRSPQGERG